MTTNLSTLKSSVPFSRLRAIKDEATKSKTTVSIPWWRQVLSTNLGYVFKVSKFRVPWKGYQKGFQKGNIFIGSLLKGLSTDLIFQTYKQKSRQAQKNRGIRSLSSGSLSCVFQKGSLWGFLGNSPVESLQNNDGKIAAWREDNLSSVSPRLKVLVSVHLLGAPGETTWGMNVCQNGNRYGNGPSWGSMLNPTEQPHSAKDSVCFLS